MKESKSAFRMGEEVFGSTKVGARHFHRWGNLTLGLFGEGSGHSNFRERTQEQFTLK